MLGRNRFEKEYRRIFSEHGIGSTIWSPLLGGLLSGKYNEGVKVDDGRFSTWNAPFLDMRWKSIITEENLAKMRKLEALAKELGYS